MRDRAGKDDLNAYFERIRHAGERVSLSTEELRAIAAAGHTVGSHTEWHEELTRLPVAEAQASIARGKQQLEEVLGREVTHFSFPFGMRRYFNEALADYCFRIGIRTIAAATPALQYAQQSARCIHRSGWRFDRAMAYNLENLRIDGRRFETLTGRSAVG